MKFWSSQHTFDHPWDIVATAAWRKYPNPMNGAVTGIDVLNQERLKNGLLRSERIIQSHFAIPTWVTTLTGFSGTQYSYELTEINTDDKRMTLVTRNLNAARFLSVDEKLHYKPDPNDEKRTVLEQEATVKVDLPAFADYCEKTFLSIYETNAKKGRKGLEWVIDQFHLENSFKFTPSSDIAAVKISGSSSQGHSELNSKMKAWATFMMTQ